MKKKVILVVIALSLLSCKSTNEIFPLDKESRLVDKNKKIPSEVKYVKDVNNVLSNFTGNWKGNYEGKNYEFRISKDIAVRHNGIKQDILKMEYRFVEDELTFSTASNFSTMNQFVISNFYGKNTLGKTNTFIYETIECGQAGQITLMKEKKMKENEMKIYYFSPPQGVSTSVGCEKVPIELQQLSNIILYKQN